MKTFLLMLLVGGGAMAQLEIPSIGFMHASTGTWHEVYGVAGSFILGPEVAEPEGIALEEVLMSQGVTLSTTAEELVLRRTDGNEVRFRIAYVATMRAISGEYVQVSAEGREYVLRLSKGHEALFMLPGVSR
jgi:hypothetical protein